MLYNGENMHTLQKGTILKDTYEIIEEIGSGGGGIVYKAKHLRLKEYVVVKKIKDEVIGRVDSEKEANVLKKLKHSYLPRIYDFIEMQGAVYTVMDFIVGENLEEVLKKEGAFSQKQVRKWAEQLGEALAYLHEQNPPIIHSDIKPANIMLTPEGNICLIDFNVSLAIGDSMESAVGISAGFSPPEQYRTLELYAKITHDEEALKSLNIKKESVIPKNNGSDSFNKGNQTERLDASEDKTEILNFNEDKTEILDSNAGKTKILFPDEDKTEMLNSNEDKIEILKAQEKLHKNVNQSDKKKEKEGKEKTHTFHTSLNKNNEKNTEYLKYIGNGIDRRTDIYSLGATLYILLTGKRIPTNFSQKTIEENLKVCVSEGFLHILLKMMQVSPENRYKNGKEYLKAVHNCKKLDKRYIALNRKKTGMRICSFILALVGVGLIFSGLQRDKRERNNLYLATLQQAEDEIGNKNYTEAFSFISSAMEFDKERVEAYEKELYALYVMGAYDDCVKKGKEYINTPDFYLKTESDKVAMGNIYYIVGSACYETEEYVAAKDLFEMAIRENQSNALYYRDYAICLAKSGESQKALEQIEIGVKLGLKEDSLFMVKGEIALNQDEKQEAIENFSKCLEITNDSNMKVRAVLCCVNLYRKEGNENLDKEIQLLESYREEQNTASNLVITEYLAQSYTRKASVDKENANAYYQSALNLFMEIYDNGYVTYQIQENIAIIYESMGELEQAENWLMQMKESYPQRYEVYKRLAYLEADKQQKKSNESRNYKQMKKYYEQSIKLYSEELQDMEMQMLMNMMEELKNGGWF